LFIRASSASDANTYNQQKLVIDGLTYQPSTYYYLKIINETTGESYNVSSNGGGSSPNYYSVAYTFTVAPNTTNVYRAEARWQSGNNLTTVYNSLTSPSNPNKPTALNWATKVSTEDFRLTASEWNTMTAKINQWRVHQGSSEMSFPVAYSGNDFTASMFNHAVNAITALSPPYSPAATVDIGDDVTAPKLNRIRDSLNSLI
jgi:hypothetical protein